MSESSLRDQNHYVLLLPNLVDEQFLTSDELREFLQTLLQENPHLLDQDLQRFTDPIQQAERLIDTACSIEIEPGQSIQWYAVRLSKDSS